jgi:hypothetical protein
MKVNPGMILDPRGTQKRDLLQLAERPTLEELKTGKVLFYNNTKLFHNNYMTIFNRTKANLAKEGINNLVEFVETPRGKSNQDLKDYAVKLSQENPVAAFVALGDIGVSPACAIISIELEKLGIPTLYYTAPPGTDLVRAVANYRAGKLCLTSLDIYQGSSVEQIETEIDTYWPDVMDALLLSGEELEKRADLKFDIDSDVTGVTEATSLAERISLSAEDMEEPAPGIGQINDLFNELHISDGLPIIPPSRRRFSEMMEYCPFDPKTVLAKEIGPSGKDILIQDVVIASIMAGCKPKYMPILVTAFKAMANKKYNFLQSVTTSHPGGNLVLVSGPLAQEVGLYGGQGCLGPGFPANLTIGRAVNLAIINACRSIPGVSDLANISSQAELTYCFAEEPGITPWETINAEWFNDEATTVYVLKAEPIHDMIDFLSPTAGHLLDTIVGCSTTLGSNNAYITGPLIILLTPDHAKLLDREGWTKDMIRNHIHKNATNESAMLKNRGIDPVRPEGFSERNPIPVTRSPEDIQIVVAGGRGGHSAVILPWALHSEGIVEQVILPDGSVPKSIEEFRNRSNL